MAARAALFAVGVAASQLLPVVATRVAGFVARHEGLLLERKSRSLSVHYRERPELEGDAAREPVEHADAEQRQSGRQRADDGEVLVDEVVLDQRFEIRVETSDLK